MNNLPLLFFGIFLTLASSWLGILFIPDMFQIGQLDRTTTQLIRPDTGEPIAGLTYTDESGNLRYGEPNPDEEFFPRPLGGEALRGKSHYISMGCLYCHSQQVRRKGFGADYDRGWGDRQSVPRDYILQERVLLGTSRTGPDLKDVGSRIPDTNWHHLHLYNPQITSRGSNMPPYAFLYEKRPIPESGPSPDALSLSGEFAVADGYEVVPTRRARELVAYLMELRLDYELPEIKMTQE